MPTGPADPAVVGVRAGACSHLGLRRRRNEDAFLADVAAGAFAVADGMGGHPAGDVASRLVIDTLARLVAPESLDEAAGPDGADDGRHQLGAALDLLATAFAEANSALLAHALARPDRNGLGTTMTAVLVAGAHAAVGHIGDSRLYRLRAGELHQVTTDHTWVEREVEQGRLTRAAARHHPNSAVLLRVLGGADASPDMLRLALEPGDRLVLCTDGVSNPVGPADFLAIVEQRLAPADIARHLCEAADARGGHDNSTAVVVDISRITAA